MRLTKMFKEFFENEKAGGIILIFCTILSLILSNSSFGESYIHFWHTKIGSESLEYWINDGLMAIFFLLIGLELEREIYIGELSSFKKASLPVFGALGGMLVPAGIFMIFNFGTATQAGGGIPMATDIAFAIGVLSIMGNKVPIALKVFLVALAVIDDLGAIFVIAIFYPSQPETGMLGLTPGMNLLIAGGIFALLLVFNRLKIKNLIPYLLAGVAMWYFMLHSGIHATVTGVLLAFAIPFQNGNEDSSSYKLQHNLHKPIAFFILPLFALANTCVAFDGNWTASLTTNSSLGIMLGLVIGKPLGIILMCFIAVKLGLSALPGKSKWHELLGMGILAGIGFTMSIFVTILAFDKAEIINHAKIAILIASLTAGVFGFIYLKLVFKKEIHLEEENLEEELITEQIDR
jgi:NhaA family Na+:H+ antiporter